MAVVDSGDAVIRLRLISVTRPDGKLDLYYIRADSGERVNVRPLERGGFYPVVVYNGVGESGFLDRINREAQRHKPTGARAYFPTPEKSEQATVGERRRHRLRVGLQYFVFV